MMDAFSSGRLESFSISASVIIDVNYLCCDAFCWEIVMNIMS